MAFSPPIGVRAGHVKEISHILSLAVIYICQHKKGFRAFSKPRILVIVCAVQLNFCPPRMKISIVSGDAVFLFRTNRQMKSSYFLLRLVFKNNGKTLFKRHWKTSVNFFVRNAKQERAKLFFILIVGISKKVT